MPCLVTVTGPDGLVTLKRSVVTSTKPYCCVESALPPVCPMDRMLFLFPRVVKQLIAGENGMAGLPTHSLKFKEFNLKNITSVIVQLRTPKRQCLRAVFT